MDTNMNVKLLLTLALAAAACGGGGPVSDDGAAEEHDSDDPEGDEDSDTDAAPARSPAPPHRASGGEPLPPCDPDPANTRPDVVVFTGEPLNMFEGDTVTLRAVVKDAEGNLDRVRLVTYAGEDLGDFERLDAEHFEIEVSWALLAQTFDIDWPESHMEWKFTAEALDTEGALGVGFTSIWLRCDEGEVLCDGACALGC